MMPKRKIIWECHICHAKGRGSKTKRLARLQVKYHYKQYHPGEHWGNATVKEANRWGNDCDAAEAAITIKSRK